MAGARAEFALTVRGPAHDHDVKIDADPRASIGELVTQLAAHTGAADGGVLFSDRLGRIPADLELAASGLRYGDVVSLSQPVAPRVRTPLGTAGPVVELMVIGGPEAGLHVGVGPGTYAVGRDPSCEITIDDPSLSRRHFTVQVGRDGAVSVADAGSSNGTAIEGQGLAAGETRALLAEQALEAGRSAFAVNPVATSMVRRGGAGLTIGFNRPPRVSRGYEPPTLRLDSPPQSHRSIHIPFFVALVPLLMGVTIYLVTKSPMMLLMAAFSPVMMIGSALGTRRSGVKDHREQVQRFEAAAEKFRAEIVQARGAEQIERRAAAPHAGDLSRRALELLPSLWERRPTDRDFLAYRVGVADQPSIVTYAFGPGGDPDLREPVEQVVDEHKTVPIVPIYVDALDTGAAGIVGDAAVTDPIARWMLTQHATLQSPRDVVIAAALSHSRLPAWSWLRWLPHARHPASPLDGEHVVAGEPEARDLIRRLVALAGERHAEQEGPAAKVRRRTAVVLLVDEDVAPEATLVDELLDGCGAVQISVIWLARERRHLPGGCGVIIEPARERAVADVTWTRTGRKVTEGSIDGISGEIAESVARSLAPLEDTTAGGAAASVPRAVSLVELLGLTDPRPGQIVDRWRRRGGSALDATIGVAGDGPYAIDLRADGPHALVAGTTGAGKSELLQTLIAALAASHPPDRLAFLLVDYKGGAAFKDCASLPHSVGMVTDLDEHQVQRALTSLNAELKRREHVLADAGARDLIELERRDPAGAPPSLVIVIDEFATLAKEVPTFVDGVVDVAQRGRSLGVHLVLATQRPGNAVTDNIRANTNLRMALRVAGPAESDDVIGAPDAARLSRSMPGRLLARTGPTELTLLQAGYVGGRTRSAADQRTIEVSDLAPKPQITTRGGTPVEPEETTDLELLVEAIAAATEQLGIEPPASPWLPALAPTASLDALSELADGADEGSAVIGIVDDPERQRQIPLTIDLAGAGGALIFGGSGAGKTTALRTLAVALARQHDPSELQLFGLDFAGLGLHVLESLPHCGAVIPGDDGERLQRLLAVMRRTIDDRGRRFSAARVPDLAGYNRLHPAEPLPRMVVLLDAYAGFTEQYERVDLGALVEAMPRLVADGRAAGVHVVITADRRMAIPTSIASLVAQRIILRMGSEDEYQMLGLRQKGLGEAKLPPGRGFLPDGREAQVATLTGSAAGEAETAAIAALGAQLAAATPNRALQIGQLPELVPAAALTPVAAAFAAPFAVDDLEMATVPVSVEDSHFVVVGPYRSGRSTALHTLASGLRESTPGLTVHLLAPRRSSLLERDGWDSVSRGMEACEAKITALLDEMFMAAAESDGEPDPVLIVLDDAGELADSHVASALETLLKRGRDGHVRVIASLETGQARHYATWIRELRKDGRGMLLDPNLDLDGELLGARLPRRSSALFPPGRGYLVIDGRAIHVQVASA